MNRPDRVVRRALTALILLSSLIACSSTLVKAPSVGIPPTSTRTVTPTAPVTSQAPGTTTADSDLISADSQTPASGYCPKTVGALVVITMNPDTPSPRCVVVTGGQHLKVVNPSNQFGAAGRTITVSFARFPPRQVAIGATTTFDQTFGSYLAPGVHEVHITPAYSAEIWLR
jgi:hypothetical protein